MMEREYSQMESNDGMADDLVINKTKKREKKEKNYFNEDCIL